MPQVRKTPEASRDLLEIWPGVAAFPVAKADRPSIAIDEKCRLLARFPEIGRGRDELAPGVRGTLVDRYVRPFRQAGDGVELLRVIHGSRDIPRLFEG